MHCNNLDFIFNSLKVNNSTLIVRKHIHLKSYKIMRSISRQNLNYQSSTRCLTTTENYLQKHVLNTHTSITEMLHTGHCFTPIYLIMPQMRKINVITHIMGCHDSHQLSGILNNSRNLTITREKIATDLQLAALTSLPQPQFFFFNWHK